MSENNNVCLECGGTGQEHSGTSYMGIDEVVSCGDCCGTGFEWPSLEIERLAAQLAQRDGELEALRGKVGDAREKVESARRHLDVESRHVADRLLIDALAALSDNQEPDALTYDEIVELAKTNPGLERFYGVDLDDDDLPDNPESPALTDKEA